MPYKHFVENERATSLVDLISRRSGAGWSKTMAINKVKQVAATAEWVPGWDDARSADGVIPISPKFESITCSSRPPRAGPTTVGVSGVLDLEPVLRPFAGHAADGR